MALTKSRARDPRNRFSVWADSIGASALWGSITALLGALALFPAIPAFSALLADRSSSFASADEAYRALFSVVGLMAFAFTNLWFLVALINFGFRAVRFVRERGVSTRWGAGWAIGSWFVPVASLILPYLVLRDVAGVGAANAEERKRSLLRFWVLWQVVNNVASFGLQAATGQDTSLIYQGFVITACVMPFFAVPMMMARKLFREIESDLKALIV